MKRSSRLKISIMDEERKACLAAREDASCSTAVDDTVQYICVCVCVCVFSSHSFWTSSSLDVPAGVTQEEGHTGFLIHLVTIK